MADAIYLYNDLLKRNSDWWLQVDREKRWLVGNHAYERYGSMLEIVEKGNGKETKLLSETGLKIPAKFMFKDYSHTCR